MFKNPPLLMLICYISVVFIATLFAAEVYASTAGGGGLPWDSWITRVLQSFTGPVTFLFSVIAFIVAGVGLAMGADFTTFSKVLLGACFGVSIIVGAQNIVSMLFSGAVVPEGVLLVLL